jgi:hypothetical protein
VIPEVVNGCKLLAAEMCNHKCLGIEVQENYRQGNVNKLQEGIEYARPIYFVKVVKLSSDVKFVRTKKLHLKQCTQISPPSGLEVPVVRKGLEVYLL